MKKALFAHCFLEFDFGDRSEGLVALVSDWGALHVRFHAIPYSKVAGMAGKSIAATLAGKVRISGKLCREINTSGSFFSFQFENMDEATRTALREAIALQSYTAPWNRRTERHLCPAEKQNKIHLQTALGESPQNAVIVRNDLLYDAHVVDFSREGILLEGRGPGFSSWNIGENVCFKLSTTKENSIAQLTGRLVRITVDFDRELNEEVFRFGLELAPMDEIAAKRYGKLLENRVPPAIAETLDRAA